MDKRREAMELLGALTECRERVEELQAAVDAAKSKLASLTLLVNKELRKYG